MGMTQKVELQKKSVLSAKSAEGEKLDTKKPQPPPRNVSAIVRQSVNKHDGWTYLGKVQSRNLTIGRNDPCHCGSGKKFKNCHLTKIHQQENNIIAGVDPLGTIPDDELASVVSSLSEKAGLTNANASAPEVGESAVESFETGECAKPKCCGGSCHSYAPAVDVP